MDDTTPDETKCPNCDSEGEDNTCSKCGSDQSETPEVSGEPETETE